MAQKFAWGEEGGSSLYINILLHIALICSNVCLHLQIAGVKCEWWSRYLLLQFLLQSSTRPFVVSIRPFRDVFIVPQDVTSWRFFYWSSVNQNFPPNVLLIVVSNHLYSSPSLLNVFKMLLEICTLTVAVLYFNFQAFT